MKIETIFVKYIKLREKLSKAKIYKIIDNTNDNIYIGSTCKTLKTRLSVHKCDYKRFLNGLGGNVKSFDIIRNRDYKIELLEKCDIKTKKELLARERFFIQNNNCVNKYIPGNFDDKGCQQYQKDYREANKNELTIKKKEKFDCECRGKYTNCGKSQHLKTSKHLNYLKSQNK